MVSFIAGHPQYGNLEELYGMGHSLGGQNWIARLSDHQIACGLEKETRVEGAILLDATWEATSLAQTSNLHSPVFVVSQQCRFSQMLLQKSQAIPSGRTTGGSLCPSNPGTARTNGRAE